METNIQKAKIMASGPITSQQIEGDTLEAVTDLFSWTPKSLWTVTAAIKFKRLAVWKENNDKPR